ncbi:hypothetical protein B7759_00801 [Burkholderia glumae]|nr:hypothetical protein KS03_2028 [Burkholderia glumae LMG 2196 = ATCC 33617]QKM54012.1 hypothetical protein CG017_02039 [Burkholderia glumae]QTP32232.1 hypothetical protein B7759_00801 [Burkholderia glumae]
MEPLPRGAPGSARGCVARRRAMSCHAALGPPAPALFCHPIFRESSMPSFAIVSVSRGFAPAPAVIVRRRFA